jgi:hypothetical protein
MNYLTRRSHRMQKHKFSVTCPSAQFLEIASSPPEHEKYCIDVLCLGCTRMHYMTHRSHQMKKH